MVVMAIVAVAFLGCSQEDNATTPTGPEILPGPPSHQGEAAVLTAPNIKSISEVFRTATAGKKVPTTGPTFDEWGSQSWLEVNGRGEVVMWNNPPGSSSNSGLVWGHFSSQATVTIGNVYGYAAQVALRGGSSPIEVMKVFAGEQVLASATFMIWQKDRGDEVEIESLRLFVIPNIRP